ncbi:MAG: hypothetical protein P4L40_22430 [Terracidiphilus sp.]|nr:hypothetical protein [Terracidiphilus sp.]
MNTAVSYDRTTEVAYVDVCEKPATDVRIDVIDVTDELGMKTQVLARVTEHGQLLGLIIQDYPAFKREIRRKYLALAVERILDLIISKVRELTSASDCSELPQVHAHAAHA